MTNETNPSRNNGAALIWGLAAVVLAGFGVWALGLPVETIGTKFGGIPNALPVPSIPKGDLDRLIELLPSAIAIALLGGMESLLSAVVALGFLERKLAPEAPPSLPALLLKAFPDPQEALFQSPEGEPLALEPEPGELWGLEEPLLGAALPGEDEPEAPFLLPSEEHPVRSRGRPGEPGPRLGVEPPGELVASPPGEVGEEEGEEGGGRGL